MHTTSDPYLLDALRPSRLPIEDLYPGMYWVLVHPFPKRKRKQPKLSRADKARQIRRLRRKGRSPASLSAQFGCSLSTVYRMLSYG